MHKKSDITAVEELDTMADIIANFLPTYEIDCLTDPFILFLRFYIYLTVIIPRLPDHKRVFDVDAEFEKVFGFPWRLYASSAINALRFDAMNERVNLKIGDVPDAGMAISWFKQTILTRGTGERAMFDSGVPSNQRFARQEKSPWLRRL